MEFQNFEGVSSYFCIDFQKLICILQGPKVNHHFRANNSVYMAMEHPRWGMITTVTTTKDVKAGEELFTHYGYGTHEFPDDFEWYWEAENLILREERLIEKEKKKKKKEGKIGKKKKLAFSENNQKTSSNETMAITDEVSKKIKNLLKYQKNADILSP